MPDAAQNNNTGIRILLPIAADLCIEKTAPPSAKKEQTNDSGGCC
jgi:hypothetical protein